MVLKKRERSEPPYISAQRSLLKKQGCASRVFKGCSLALAFFSTTPLASYLGSLPLLTQEGIFFCWPTRSSSGNRMTGLQTVTISLGLRQTRKAAS